VWAGFHGPVVRSATALCEVLGRELGKACTPSEDMQRRIADAQGGH
jgi:hypothetical protein